MDFRIKSDYGPSGSQPQAIRQLVEGIESGYGYQTLLGVTGSGKTFTMANIIERTQLPALIMAPNKTLAAQLYSEFRQLFPENAVEYFVSYYDYYQPEAYLPSSDTYISKDADINKEIEKLRHRTTSSLLDRKDVIVVATVSAIYGLGSPKEYTDATMYLRVGDDIGRDMLLKKLVQMHYERRQKSISEGQIRVRGPVMDVYPPYGEFILRIKADRSLESIKILDPVSMDVQKELDGVRVYPAVHYIIDEKRLERALKSIGDELSQRIEHLQSLDKMIEANRIKQKTEYDLELIREMGYCKGIENYSMHLEARRPGEPPNTLLDFFPKDWLCFIDESHISVPQIRGMYLGDRARKETLIQYGFRLPSALDNRPLRYEEFDEKLSHTVFVSATPSKYERETSIQTVEQIIRPTGLLDPEVEIRPAADQVGDFLKMLEKMAAKGKRVLATTLTKRMSEDLSEYIEKRGYRVKYLHSEIATLDRVDILKELRSGEIDAVVGVNLLREGLDLPEVALVAIMDADQEGFLRSETSLVQTIGRCSRNLDGKVILYADKITGSMRRALDETTRRRAIQLEYNKKHGIKPRTIIKGVHERIVKKKTDDVTPKKQQADLPRQEVERLMMEAAQKMDFERAIMLKKMLEEAG